MKTYIVKSVRLTCMALLALLASIVATTVATTAAYAADALHIVDAEIPIPPPGVPVMAGFAKIMNHSAEEIVVVSASSDSFGKVEIHETTIKDDVARMRKMKELVVPADAMLTLTHGKTHFMLKNPVADLKPDQNVEIQLTMSDGKTQSVVFKLIEGMHKAHGTDHKMDKHGDAHDEDHEVKN